jgi:methyl-accepting chemotaxis protein
MRGFGIKAKIWLSIAIFGAGYVALLILLQWTTSQTQAHMKIASDSLFPAALSSQDAAAAFQKLTKRYSDAVLMQDKKALSDAEQDADAVFSALRQAKEKTAFNPARQNEISSLLDRFSDIEKRSQSTYTVMVESPDKMTEKNQADIVTLAHDNKQMEASLGDLRTGLSKDFESELLIVTDWSERQRTFGMLVLLIAVICGSVISGIVISRQIGRPLNELATRLTDIAEGEGDLTKRLEFSGHDEIGEAGSAFDQFMEKLQGIMRQVAANTHQLASAISQISESATLTAQRSETQQNQTSQVADAMKQMSLTVLQVSENSSLAAEASRKAAETAREGGTIVEDTLNKMRTIATSVQGTAKKMAELGKSSDQIGHIARVIDDIADQTNLLALNAAIEAARAGEQGRGFAVVADEVRKLAERTTTATKEIAQMINTIQEETKMAVAAMEAGTKQVEEGLESTSRAGDSLRQIIHMSEEVGEMITHIATAATEQSNATEEVNNNLNEIAAITRESAQGAQQSATACGDLTNLASELQGIVSKFRLEDSGEQAGQVRAAQIGRSSSKSNDFGAAAFSVPSTPVLSTPVPSTIDKFRAKRAGAGI